MLNKNKYYIILFLVILISIMMTPQKITKMERVLLKFNLDDKWSSGYNVQCSTGYGKHNKSTTVKTSHCSCFIASLCDILGFYIPSPPEYSQFHLADKQLDWLSSNEGIREGWIDIDVSLPEKYIKAQKLANKGYFVIAGVTHDDNINGHIGVVRPYTNVNYNIISKRGPIIMASSVPNTYASYLDDEFRLNEKMFQHIKGRIKFFYNKRIPV